MFNTKQSYFFQSQLKTQNKIYNAKPSIVANKLYYFCKIQKNLQKIITASIPDNLESYNDYDGVCDDLCIFPLVHVHGNESSHDMYVRGTIIHPITHKQFGKNYEFHVDTLLSPEQIKDTINQGKNFPSPLNCKCPICGK